MKEDCNYSDDMKTVIDISKSVIKKLGIQNFKSQPGQQKYTILFSITNTGQSTDERWSNFPVLIDVENEFVRIYILFSIQGKTYSFSNPEMRLMVLDYINLVNNQLCIGMLKFSNSKQHVRFENYFCFSCLNRKYWTSIFHNYLVNAFNSYKAFGFGILRITEQPEKIRKEDLNYLCQLCSSKFFGTAPQTSKKQTTGTNNQLLENEESELPEKFIKISEVIINKIESEKLHEYFDVSNIIKRSERYYYDNSKLKSLNTAIENKYTINFEFYRILVDILVVLYYKQIIFSCLPFDLIKIEVEAQKVNRFIFGFQNAEEYLAKHPVTLSKYKISIWKQITSFNLLMYSYRAYPDKNITTDEKLCLSNFEQEKLTSKSLIIGNGGFGTVYSNKYCGIPVAIKFPSNRKEDCVSGNERIRREYQITRLLRHPCILSVYGYIEFDKKIGYVMQYCEKGSLNEYIKEKKDYSHQDKIKFLIKLSSAIRYIHYKNFAHLDIKPHNIFLKDNNPVIGDFGLSANILNEKNPGWKLGCTIYYSPPEQIKNSAPRKSSDIWAFGMVMYQFLIGKDPFGFLRDYRKIEKDAFYKLIKQDNVRPKIPEEFEEDHFNESTIMKKCWKLNPSKRPSIEHIIDRLLQALNSQDYKSQTCK